jgi:hypothetical protein
MKTFYVQYNIGKCKYVVSHHDGVQTHRDGSPFFGCAIFHNKKLLSKFIAGLLESGYIERRS